MVSTFGKNSSEISDIKQLVFISIPLEHKIKFLGVTLLFFRRCIFSLNFWAGTTIKITSQKSKSFKFKLRNISFENLIPGRNFDALFLFNSPKFFLVLKKSETLFFCEKTFANASPQDPVPIIPTLKSFFIMYLKAILVLARYIVCLLSHR